MKINAIRPIPTANVTNTPKISAIQPFRSMPLLPIANQLNTLTAIMIAITVTAIATTTQLLKRRTLFLHQPANTGVLNISGKSFLRRATPRGKVPPP